MIFYTNEEHINNILLR